ncbi:phosphatase PAP2 family protein [Undibacterium arcticum]
MSSAPFFFPSDPFMNHSETWLRRHYLKLLILFGGVLLPLYLFGTLAEDVVEKEIFFCSTSLFSCSSTVMQTPCSMRPWYFFTRAGSAAALAPFDVLVFFSTCYDGEIECKRLFLGSCGGRGGVAQYARQTRFFARGRPDFWISLLPETTFSFPSGHAMHSMAVVAALVALTWHSRWRWLVALIGVCFVFLVGLSRIYLGVHFPSDILAGWTASLTWVIGLSVLFKDVWQQRRRTGTSVAAKFD